MTAEEFATRHDRAAALKHDLAKYVAWRSANLAESAWTGPLTEEWVAAIRDDLLATRTGGGRSESATEVWERLGAPMLAEEATGDLEAIAAAMRVVAAAESALRADDRARLTALRLELRDAQRRIREACTALVRTTRAG